MRRWECDHFGRTPTVQTGLATSDPQPDPSQCLRGTARGKWNPHRLSLLPVHRPERIREQGALRTHFAHAIDVAPTILEIAGIPMPTHIDGFEQQPMHGVTFADSLTDANAPERHTQLALQTACLLWRSVSDRQGSTSGWLVMRATVGSQAREPANCRVPFRPAQTGDRISNSAVFIYAATYAHQADALADYEALLDLHEIRLLGPYDVAVITKDADGKVHVQKHEKPTQHGAWGGVLVGALVGVLFPPAVVGVATVGGAAAIGGVLGGLGGHFSEGMSRSDAKELGDLLVAGQAALIVIGESSAKEEFDKALMRAEKSVEKEIDADHGELKRELEETEKRLGAG